MDEGERVRRRCAQFFVDVEGWKMVVGYRFLGRISLWSGRLESGGGGGESSKSELPIQEIARNFPSNLAVTSEKTPKPLNGISIAVDSVGEFMVSGKTGGPRP